MDIIKRIFIVIWIIIFFIFNLCGGFIILPIIIYIFTGKFDDPVVNIINIYDSGQKLIESFFDNIKNNKCNGQFWK
jgi:hypothetical protein